MAKNPHFRVLALTATPGNDPKTVQTLIDGLHISRIEIRNEESLDLKPYIHKKVGGHATALEFCSKNYIDLCSTSNKSESCSREAKGLARQRYECMLVHVV